LLSQRAQALRSGTRYTMVSMGAEIKDPQTGPSLGRVEVPCCQLVIDRVTPNLSYGQIENARGPVDHLVPGALQVREAQLPGPKAGTNVATAGGAKTGAPVPARAGRAAMAAATEGASAPNCKNDDKW